MTADLEPAQTEGRLFVKKDAIQDFLDSKLNPELQPVVLGMNNRLKGKFGNEFVTLVVLGSNGNGGWAARLAVGQEEKPIDSDLDLAVVINTSKSKTTLPGSIYNEARNYLDTTKTHLLVCQKINPNNVFFNVSDMDFYVNNALKWVTNPKGDQGKLPNFYRLLSLDLPYLSGSSQLLADFDRKLKSRYADKEYAIIKQEIEMSICQVQLKWLVSHRGHKGQPLKRAAERLARMKRKYLFGDDED